MTNIYHKAQNNLAKMGLSSNCCSYPKYDCWTLAVFPKINGTVVCIPFYSELSIELLSERQTVTVPSHYQALTPFSAKAETK